MFTYIQQTTPLLQAIGKKILKKSAEISDPVHFCTDHLAPKNIISVKILMDGMKLRF